jgi:metacaspase-1
MRMLLLWLALLAVTPPPSTDNRFALLIGIGTYPAALGVEPLNAQNDLRLMRQTLLGQGFRPGHILTLPDRQATRRAIEHRLDSLGRALPAGARLVVLYSGHGLQIPDDNRDEPDHLDEALLPYDGHPDKPATLLRDDRLGTYLTRLRARVGPTGHILFLFDSCHSASMLRDNKAGSGRGVGTLPTSFLPRPGTSGWFERQARPLPGLGRYALLAATTDGQPSYECTDENGHPHGPLTLAICRAWQQRTPPTYLAFFEQIRGQMAVLAPYQLPTLEGDRHARFLGL